MTATQLPARSKLNHLLSLFKRQKTVTPQVNSKFTVEQLEQFRRFFALLQKGWEIQTVYEHGLVEMRKMRDTGKSWFTTWVNVPMLYIDQDAPKNPAKTMFALAHNGYEFAIDTKSKRVLIFRDFQVVCKVTPQADLWIDEDEEAKAFEVINLFQG